MRRDQSCSNLRKEIVEIGIDEISVYIRVTRPTSPRFTTTIGHRAMPGKAAAGKTVSEEPRTRSRSASEIAAAARSMPLTASPKKTTSGLINPPHASHRGTGCSSTLRLRPSRSSTKDSPDSATSSSRRAPRSRSASLPSGEESRCSASRRSAALSPSSREARNRWVAVGTRSSTTLEKIARKFVKGTRLDHEGVDVENRLGVVLASDIQAMRTPEIRNPGSRRDARTGQSDDVPTARKHFGTSARGDVIFLHHRKAYQGERAIFAADLGC